MLTQAKAVYTSLSQAVGEEEGALFNGKIQEITPSLRYCAYNIGDKQAAGDLTRDQRMDLLVAQTKEEQASSLHEVEWRGRRMAVRQEKVRRFLLSHQESDSELERADDAEARCQVFESLLLECKDALQVLKEELVEDPEFRARQQVRCSCCRVLVLIQLYSINYSLCRLARVKLLPAISSTPICSSSDTRSRWPGTRSCSPL